MPTIILGHYCFCHIILFETEERKQDPNHPANTKPIPLGFCPRTGISVQSLPSNRILQAEFF